MMPQPTLSTVHDAMIKAQDASKKESEKMSAYPFKHYPSKIERARAICERHATSLPEFLRQCINSLIEDYTPGQDQTPAEE